MGRIIDITHKIGEETTYKNKKKGYTFSCSFIVEESTLFGHVLQYKVRCFIKMEDLEEFIKNKMLESASIKKLVNDYALEIFWPFISNYFWTADTRKYPNYEKFYIYKIIENKGKKSITWVNNMEVINKLKEKQFCKKGCSIEPISLDSYNIKEGLNMISEQDREYIIERYDYLKWLEKIHISTIKDITKKINTKKYEVGEVSLETKVLNDGLYIRWEIDADIHGCLKVYRRDEEFYHDPFNTEENGILIIDSRQREGEIIDYLEQDKSYYYTVNYKEDRRVEKKVIGKKEIPSKTSHHIRFSTKLPIKLPTREKTEIEKFEEKQRHEIEMERIRQVYIKEKTVEEVKNKFDKKRLREKIIKEETEKLRKEILQGQTLDEAGPRELQEYGRAVEDLQDITNKIFINDLK